MSRGQSPPREANQLGAERNRPLDASETSLWMHLRPDGREDLSFQKPGRRQLYRFPSATGRGGKEKWLWEHWGRPTGPRPPSGAVRGHILCRACGYPQDWRLKQREGVSRRCPWGWGHVAADGGIPEDAKNRAHQCWWTIWSHDHLSGRQRGQVTTKVTQHQGLQIWAHLSRVTARTQTLTQLKKSWIDWKYTKRMSLTRINLVSAISGTVGSKERLNWIIEIIKAHSLDLWEMWLKSMLNVFLLMINTQSSLGGAARFSK